MSLRICLFYFNPSCLFLPLSSRLPISHSARLSLHQKINRLLWVLSSSPTLVCCYVCVVSALFLGWPLFVFMHNSFEKPPTLLLPKGWHSLSLRLVVEYRSTDLCITHLSCMWTFHADYSANTTIFSCRVEVHLWWDSSASSFSLSVASHFGLFCFLTTTSLMSLNWILSVIPFFYSDAQVLIFLLCTLIAYLVYLY